MFRCLTVTIIIYHLYYTVELNSKMQRWLSSHANLSSTLKIDLRLCSKANFLKRGALKSESLFGRKWHQVHPLSPPFHQFVKTYYFCRISADIYEVGFIKSTITFICEWCIGGKLIGREVMSKSVWFVPICRILQKLIMKSAVFVLAYKQVY